MLNVSAVAENDLAEAKYRFLFLTIERKPDLEWDVHRLYRQTNI